MRLGFVYTTRTESICVCWTLSIICYIYERNQPMMMMMMMMMINEYLFLVESFPFPDPVYFYSSRSIPFYLFSFFV